MYPMRHYFILFSLLFSIPTAAAQTQSMVVDDNGNALSYQALLEKNELAGLSIAVVDNFDVIHSFAGGHKDYSSKEAVDANTAFNAASISKPVVATLAVMLAAHGKLDLDSDVNRYLKRWTLPDSDFGKKVTLRQLLSHTAGLDHSGYSSHYLGDKIPTTVDTLNTYKNQAISMKYQPGTNWQYSGGSFLIAQLVLEDATGKSLAALSEDMLFAPLGMANTTFYQHGHKRFPSNVAKAHDGAREVIATGIPICPEAACGMWTNALDFAKFSIEIQNALARRPTKVISPQMADALIDIHTTTLSGGWSMGWMRNLAQGNLDWFSHSGYNNGTGGLAMATTEGGKGIFVFGNGAYRARVNTINQLVAAVVGSLGWKKELVSASQAPSPSIVETLVGEYENLTPHHFSPFAKKVKIEKRGNTLFLINSQNNSSGLPLVHTGDNKFKVDELVNSQIGLRKGKGDQVFITLEHTELQLVSDALKKIK